MNQGTRIYLVSNGRSILGQHGHAEIGESILFQVGAA